jgi:hypothetical protein
LSARDRRGCGVLLATNSLLGVLLFLHGAASYVFVRFAQAQDSRLKNLNLTRGP